MIWRFILFSWLYLILWNTGILATNAPDDSGLAPHSTFKEMIGEALLHHDPSARKYFQEELDRLFQDLSTYSRSTPFEILASLFLQNKEAVAQSLILAADSFFLEKKSAFRFIKTTFVEDKQYHLLLLEHKKTGLRFYVKPVFHYVDNSSGKIETLMQRQVAGCVPTFIIHLPEGKGQYYAELDLEPFHYSILKTWMDEVMSPLIRAGNFEDWMELRLFYLEKIRSALKKTLEDLQKAGFSHGHPHPRNFLIRIKARNGDIIPLTQKSLFTQKGKLRKKILREGEIEVKLIDWKLLDASPYTPSSSWSQSEYIGRDFSGITFPQNTEFIRTGFLPNRKLGTFSYMMYTSLEGASFLECTLPRYFNGSVLNRARFVHIKTPIQMEMRAPFLPSFQLSDLDDTEFLETDFTPLPESFGNLVSSSGLYFEGSVARRAKFIDCQLPLAVFIGSSLEGTLFVRSSLSGSIFQNTRIRNAAFIHSDLTEIRCDGLFFEDFKSAALYRAQLSLKLFLAMQALYPPETLKTLTFSSDYVSNNVFVTNPKGRKLRRELQKYYKRKKQKEAFKDPLPLEFRKSA